MDPPSRVARPGAAALLAYACLSVALLAAIAHPGSAQPAGPPGPSAEPALSNVTEGRYIVRFAEGAARLAAGRRPLQDGFEGAARTLAARLDRRLRRRALASSPGGGLGSNLGGGGGGLAVEHAFHTIFPAVVARMSPAAAAAARADPSVLSVEPDAAMRVSFLVQFDATHPLDSSNDNVVDGRFTYSSAGCGVNVYVLDTGMNGPADNAAWSVEVEQRTNGTVFDAVEPPTSPTYRRDCHGHGSFVGTIVGGLINGVAKKVQLFGVKVADCSGASTSARLLAGIDFVQANVRMPAVVLMPLAGPRSTAVNDAVKGLTDAGVPVVAAAGNSGVSACNVSPASASATSAAITVAAASRSGGGSNMRRKIPTSNFGTCVTLFAVGEGVQGVWSDGSIRSESGTSGAAALVAGAVAMVLDGNSFLSPGQIRDSINLRAIENAISELNFQIATRDTPNRLLATDLLVDRFFEFQRPACRPCDPPCRNGGICRLGLVTCQCPPNFSGAQCGTFDPFKTVSIEPNFLGNPLFNGFVAGQNASISFKCNTPCRPTADITLRSLATGTLPEINIQLAVNFPSPAADASATIRFTVPRINDRLFQIVYRSSFPFNAESISGSVWLSTVCAIPPIDVCERPRVIDTTALVVSAFPRIPRPGDPFVCIGGSGTGNVPCQFPLVHTGLNRFHTLVRLRLPRGGPRRLELFTFAPTFEREHDIKLLAGCPGSTTLFQTVASGQTLFSTKRFDRNFCGEGSPSAGQNQYLSATIDPSALGADTADTPLYAVVSSLIGSDPGSFTLVIKDPVCLNPPPGPTPTASPSPSPSPSPPPSPSPSPTPAPSPLCAAAVFVPACAANASGSAGALFRYTPAASGSLTLSLCSPATTFDTMLSLYEGCGADGRVGTLRAADNDGCGGSQASRLVAPVVAGRDYFISVAGVGGAAGRFLLTITDHSCPGAPSCTAFPAIVPCAAVIVDSNVGRPNLLQTHFVSGEAFYRLSVPTTRNVTISLCSNLTNFDTYLHVFDGCPINGTLPAPFRAALNDDGCSDFGSRGSFAAVAGRSYVVVVEGWRAAAGRFAMQVTDSVCRPGVAAGAPAAFLPDLAPTATPGAGPEAAPPATLPLPPLVTPAPTPSGPRNCDAVPVAFAGGCTSGGVQGNTLGAPSLSAAHSSGEGYHAFTFPTARNVTLSTCGCTTNFDTVLSVYPASSCPRNATAPVAPLATNDDSSCAPASLVSFEAQANVTYIAVVEGYGQDAGEYTLILTDPTCPPLGACAAAGARTVASCGPQVPGSTAGVPRFLPDAAVPPEHAAFTAGTLLYTITLPTARTVTLDVCGATDSPFDTLLYVYAGCPLLPGVARVAADDNGCGDEAPFRSRLSFPAAAGVNYTVVVTGIGASEGSFLLRITDLIACGPPTPSPTPTPSATPTATPTPAGQSACGAATLDIPICSQVQGTTVGGLNRINRPNTNSPEKIYTFTPTANGVVGIDTNFIRTNFATVVTLYRGCPLDAGSTVVAPQGTVTQARLPNGQPGGTRSAFPVTRNLRYAFAVEGAGTASGLFGVSLTSQSFLCPSTPTQSRPGIRRGLLQDGESLGEPLPTFPRSFRFEDPLFALLNADGAPAVPPPLPPPSLAPACSNLRTLAPCKARSIAGSTVGTVSRFFPDRPGVALILAGLPSTRLLSITLCGAGGTPPDFEVALGAIVDCDLSTYQFDKTACAEGGYGGTLEGYFLANRTYQILVTGWTPESAGRFTLTIDDLEGACAESAPPLRDVDSDVAAGALLALGEGTALPSGTGAEEVVLLRLTLAPRAAWDAVESPLRLQRALAALLGISPRRLVVRSAVPADSPAGAYDAAVLVRGPAAARDRERRLLAEASLAEVLASLERLLASGGAGLALADFAVLSAAASRSLATGLAPVSNSTAFFQPWSPPLSGADPALSPTIPLAIAALAAVFGLVLQRLAAAAR